MTLAAVAEPWVVRHRGFVAGVVIVATVLAATGWPISIGFWVLALVLLLASAYLTVIVLIPGYLILLPLHFLLDKGKARWCRTAAHLTVPVGQLLVGLWCYLTMFDLGDVGAVRLPFANANVSALAIMAVSSLTWIVAAGRVEEAKEWLKETVTPPPRPEPRHRAVPEPEPEPPEPGDAYWSDEPIVVWRSWSWNGSTLRGFVVEWPTTRLTAVCPMCSSAPNWSHTCGIYGVKDRTDMPRWTVGPVDAVGLVELWGDVIEHERGYRASEARIVELWVKPDIVDEVRRRYPGVKVHPERDGRFRG